MSSSQPVDPVLARVHWPSLVGGPLEELVWGLVDDLGAQEMIWRAGTVDGVNAADGGRDIEVTFRTANTDGSKHSERWWIESKGRAGTVSKTLVANAVVNATAFAEVDVVVVASNSVFTNAAHDWTREWNSQSNRPKAVLWDRENLAAMVRRAPHVAARVLPEALDEQERLGLLMSRFSVFGEVPSLVDLSYFWEHRAAFESLDNPLPYIAMMLYADDEENWEDRPWSILVPDTSEARLFLLLEAFLSIPGSLLAEKLRPLVAEKQFRVAAHLIISVAEKIDASVAAGIANNPLAWLEDVGELSEETVADWRERVTYFILRDIQDQMGTICGHDCNRVLTERSAYPIEVDSDRYFRRFDRPEERPQERYLTIINTNEPCLVGLELRPEDGCLVTQELTDAYGTTRDFFEDLARIVGFRRTHRTRQA